MTTLTKKTFNWGGWLTAQFSPLSSCSKHGSMQAEMVLELRVLHLVGHRTSPDSHMEGSLSKRELKACPTVTYFFQQVHIS